MWQRTRPHFNLHTSRLKWNVIILTWLTTGWPNFQKTLEWRLVEPNKNLLHSWQYWIKISKSEGTFCCKNWKWNPAAAFPDGLFLLLPLLLRNQQFPVSDKCFDGRKLVQLQQEPVDFTHKNHQPKTSDRQALSAKVVGSKPLMEEHRFEWNKYTTPPALEGLSLALQSVIFPF